MVFKEGDSAGCQNATRTARVQFTCEADPASFTSLAYSEDQSSVCTAVFEQSSIYGCPVCSAEDFTRDEGECEDGRMVVRFVKNEDSRCNGVVKDVEESCGDLTLNFGLAVVLSVLIMVALIAFVTVLVVIVLKNRRLKVKYSQLQASNVEMDELDE